jgi:hypothetical protein
MSIAAPVLRSGGKLLLALAILDRLSGVTAVLMLTDVQPNRIIHVQLAVYSLCLTVSHTDDCCTAAIVAVVTAFLVVAVHLGLYQYLHLFGETSVRERAALALGVTVVTNITVALTSALSSYTFGAVLAAVRACKEYASTLPPAGTMWHWTGRLLNAVTNIVLVMSFWAGSPSSTATMVSTLRSTAAAIKALTWMGEWPGAIYMRSSIDLLMHTTLGVPGNRLVELMFLLSLPLAFVQVRRFPSSWAVVIPVAARYLAVEYAFGRPPSDWIFTAYLEAIQVLQTGALLVLNSDWWKAATVFTSLSYAEEEEEEEELCTQSTLG